MQKAESVYEMYYEFEEAVVKDARDTGFWHLNRGEKEKYLTVKIEAPEEDILRYLKKKMLHGDHTEITAAIEEAIEDSYQTTDRTGH